MERRLDPGLVPEGSLWCDCADAPWSVDKRAAAAAASLVAHAPECGFPERLCSVRAHRVTVHEDCGREMPYRFCRCEHS